MRKRNYLFRFLLIFLLKGSSWVLILSGPVRVMSPKGTIVCYSSLGDSVEQLRQALNVTCFSRY